MMRHARRDDRRASQKRASESIGVLCGPVFLGDEARFYEERTMQPMVFEDTEIEMISRDGEVWARGTQIAHALGYRNASRAIRDIYQRNADEFTDTMTAVIDLPTQGGLQKARVFSLRGAHLIAMFARTPKAKAFRRWVLDLIDSVQRGGEHAKRQWEQWHQVLEDKREQASADGRGLARWRWEKAGVGSTERYWRERMQLCLPLGH